MHADEKLSAFVELERQVPEDWLKNVLLKKDQLRQWVLWVSKGKSELKDSHIARCCLTESMKPLVKARSVLLQPTEKLDTSR